MASSAPPTPETVVDRLDGYPPPYCSEVLRHFERYSTAIATVEDLATVICDRDDQAGTERQVAIRLHHATLPKLSDEGILDYDPERNTARYPGAEPDDRPGPE